MKKVSVGINQEAQLRQQQQAGWKAQKLKAAIEFFEGYFLEADPIKLHNEGFENYLLRLYAESYTGLPSEMGARNRAILSQIDIEPLRKLQSEYNAYKCPFDPSTMQVPKDYDYNVYATNEAQLKRYNLLKDFCKGMNAYIKEYGNYSLPRMQLKDICQPTPNEWQPDPEQLLFTFKKLQ
jgi:hypothetical protein